MYLQGSGTGVCGLMASCFIGAHGQVILTDNNPEVHAHHYIPTYLLHTRLIINPQLGSLGLLWLLYDIQTRQSHASYIKDHVCTDCVPFQYITSYSLSHEASRVYNSIMLEYIYHELTL